MLDYAMDYARRLLKVGHRSGNKGAQCVANIEIVLMELSAEKIDLANKRLKKVNKVCDESVGKLILLNIPSIEAQVALGGGEIIKAKEILESNYKTIRDFGWEVLTSIIETDLAKAYYQLGNYQKAEELALMGYKRAKKTTDIKRQRNVVKVLALISTELEKEDEALNYYKKYIELEQKVNTSTRQRKLAFSKALQRVKDEQLASVKDAN
jgi:tetratricopeptide (TPR) repeat protein